MEVPEIINNTAYLPNVGAIVSLGGDTKAIKKPTTPVKEDENSSSNVSFWGSNNLFPQQAYADVVKSTIARPIIDFQTRILYGGGIDIVLAEHDDDGKEKLIKDDSALEPAKLFARQASINNYLRVATTDFYFFYNIFPELLMNRRGNIVNINPIKAPKCRWEVRTSGMVSDNLFVHPDWANGSESTATKIPTIDPYNFAIENLKEKPKPKFIYPLSYPDPLNDYYALAPWDSFRQSKWYDYVKSIPEFKAALMKNQMSIKYHIEISTDFWEWRYGLLWPKGTANPEKKKELMQEYLQELSDLMAGPENAGKFLLTHSMFDNARNVNRELVKITLLEDKYPDGILTQDSTEGSSHGIFAFGVHPTLLGHAPGSAKSSLGAGSGSDQRVAWNNYLQLAQLHKDIILEPLNFIRDFNGWDKRIQFRFKHSIQNVLDTHNENQQMAS